MSELNLYFFTANMEYSIRKEQAYIDWGKGIKGPHDLQACYQ